jgi:hypothetical protein
MPILTSRQSPTFSDEPPSGPVRLHLPHSQTLSGSATLRTPKGPLHVADVSTRNFKQPTMPSATPPPC